MARRILIVALAGLGAAGVLTLRPGVAECTYCPSYRCSGPCGGSCKCVRRPGDMAGRCLGFRNARQLLEQGWIEVSPAGSRASTG
jgi:hypothetical protein